MTESSQKILDQVSLKSYKALSALKSTPISFDHFLIENNCIELAFSLSCLSNDQELVEKLTKAPKLINQLGFARHKFINRIFYKNLISLILARIASSGDLEAFSSWDHYLFGAHLQLDDTPEWFAEAFWDINRHAISMSHDYKFSPPREKDITTESPLIFVFKGPPQLAHFQNLALLLHNFSFIGKSHLIRLIFLDVMPSQAIDLPCKCFKLGHLSIKDKIRSYFNIIYSTRACALYWVASVQTIGLYMFKQAAPIQGYWSMKYHSIYSPFIQTYLRTSTFNDTLDVDGKHWLGVPADLNNLALIPNSDRSYSDFLQSCYNSNLPLKIVTHGREIKVSNSYFAQLIQQVLRESNATWSYSGRKKAIWHTFDNPSINFSGWLTMPQMIQQISQALLYLDSFPFGGGHTAFNALRSSKPIIMLNTDQNRRCSFMMHLTDLISMYDPLTCHSEYGIFEHISSMSQFLTSIISKDGIAFDTLASIQSRQSSIFKRYTSGFNREKEFNKLWRKLRS